MNTQQFTEASYLDRQPRAESQPELCALPPQVGAPLRDLFVPGHVQINSAFTSVESPSGWVGIPTPANSTVGRTDDILAGGALRFTQTTMQLLTDQLNSLNSLTSSIVCGGVSEETALVCLRTQLADSEKSISISRA